MLVDALPVGLLVSTIGSIPIAEAWIRYVLNGPGRRATTGLSRIDSSLLRTMDPEERE